MLNNKDKTRLFFLLIALLILPGAFAYDVPASNRIEYNLNYDWKFIKSSPSGAETQSFNDTAWQTVSLPHTYNDIDLFDTWVTGSGNYGWAGKTWYRKHFKLDATLTGRKVFVEFEGIRQAGEFYINGTWVGRHENGVGPAGIDITNFVRFGAEDNILAVQVNNSLGYAEQATGTSYQWNTPPFLPNYGGIVSNAKLHVIDKVYQTLPLFSNLGTTGTYAYATDINVAQATATITAESQIKNESGAVKNISYQVLVVDGNGNNVLSIPGPTESLASGQTKTLIASAKLVGAKFWSPEYPYLYKLFTVIKSGTTVLDVVESPLGIRQVKFNVTDGLTINGARAYLDGYAPRSTMEWATVGKAPSWLEEYDFKLMKESNGNFLRPMHVAPSKMDVVAADKFGVIFACPAGDAEGDGAGRQWQQRVELMRDVMIYYRNNPSVIFWEGGNQNISVVHMQEMVDLRRTWDPHGGRFAGTRSSSAELAPITEYMSSMDNPNASATHPLWDAEWARAESPRRIWDKFTPPAFGYVNVANTANVITEYPNLSFKLNSTEDLARDNVKRYNDRWSLRGGQGLAKVMVGGAKIIFADSVSHGRMIDTELARVSGVVDAARLPKQNYYALRVAQNEKDDIHVLGHWNYPSGTVKDIIVIANTETVVLEQYDLAGNFIRDYRTPVRTNHFEFSFAKIAWQPGKIKAIGYKAGKKVVEHQLVTTGVATKLRITPITGPQGFIADGSDIAMFDIEAVDAAGLRVPTQQGKVSFTYSGEAKFLGGYNSGVENSIFKDYVQTENGINRVFVRATRNAGTFTLNATSPGLTNASATVTARAFSVTNGLTTTKPQVYGQTLVSQPVNNFNFTDIVDAKPATVYISDPVIITGMASAQNIVIAQSDTAAEYSINGGGFTSLPGKVANNDQVRVRLTSDSGNAITRYARIDIAGVSDEFSVTTKSATVPDDINLALLKPVTASIQQAGNEAAKAVDGNATSRWAAESWPEWISVDLGQLYKVGRVDISPYANRAYQFLIEGSTDGVKFTTLSDMTKNTQASSVISASFSPQYVRHVRLTFVGANAYTGGWSSIYELKVFEAKLDLVPNPFSIKAVTGVDVFTDVISEPFIVTGIEAPTSIAIINSSETASYSVNNGPFKSDPGTVANNDQVRVMLSTGSQPQNTHFATISIGGVTGDFKVTTK